jgi:hypothetical protein
LDRGGEIVDQLTAGTLGIEVPEPGVAHRIAQLVGGGWTWTGSSRSLGIAYTMRRFGVVHPHELDAESSGNPW